MNLGVRDLKTNLSRHLRRVRAGASLTITDRGRAIAIIQPVGSVADLAWVHRLVSQGGGRWQGGKPAGLPAPIKMSGRGKSVSAMLLEDRG